MKKLLFSLMAMLVMVASPMAAFAQTNDSTVVNSGDNATVSTNSNQNTTISVNNTNQATVSQTVEASTNTGGNSADGNISMNGAGASINTGAATVGTSMGVDVNHNTTAISVPNTMGNTLNGNDVVNTGDKANVSANLNSNTTVSVNNYNAASISQSAYGSANTGENDADKNIGGASITTGNASVMNTMNVVANKNTTGISGGTNGNSVTNGGMLTNTGDHANINTNTNDNLFVGVNNTNSAFVNQLVYGMANTGNNDADKNIGGAHIMTGSAAVGSSMGIGANSNMTGISGLGLFPLSLNLNDIVNTGDHLNANANQNTNVVVSANSFNSLASFQSLFASATSGGNDEDGNIGMAHIGSGNAGLGSSFMLGANANSTLLGNITGLWALLFS